MNGYQAPHYTIRERFWNALGFGRPSTPDDLDQQHMAPGRIVTETTISFDWADRLRVLVSGKIVSIGSIKTDVPVGRAETTTNSAVI